MQKKTFAGDCFTGTKCKVYDVSQKKIIGTFESISDAAQFLNILPNRAFEIMKNKAKNKTNGLGIVITIRPAS